MNGIAATPRNQYDDMVESIFIGPTPLRPRRIVQNYA